MHCGECNGSEPNATRVVFAGNKMEPRMHSPLFWIEWLDRLDRVLTSTRQDMVMLNRAITPRGIEAVERAKRQLAALTDDLPLMDRAVLAGPEPALAGENAADDLQKALDAAVGRLAKLVEILPAGPAACRERMLAEMDGALRDSRYEAAMLLAPRRRQPQASGARAPGLGP